MRLKPFRNIRGCVLTFMAALALVLTFVLPAQAHKVYVFAWVEGDTVQVDAYFSKSKKAQDSLVEVFDDAGKKLLEGKTDKEGHFSFKVPQKTNLHIVVAASMGHKNEFLLKASELPDTIGGAATPTPGTGAASTPAPAPAPAAAGSASTPAPAPAVSTMDEEQLRRVVDEVVTKHVAPLARAVASLKEEDEGPTVTEVVGGLGWIFGLMGLVMYFRSRKG